MSPTSFPTFASQGCVDGNICIRVASMTQSPPPIWWWSIYDSPLFATIAQSGCSIAGCEAIEVKESFRTEWIAGTELWGVGCQFQMSTGNAISSYSSSIDVRITTVSNQVITGIGVIKKAQDNTEWDFGSNFAECVPATKNPTASPSLSAMPTSTVENPLWPPWRLKNFTSCVQLKQFVEVLRALVIVHKREQSNN